MADGRSIYGDIMGQLAFLGVSKLWGWRRSDFVTLLVLPALVSDAEMNVVDV